MKKTTKKNVLAWLNQFLLLVALFVGVTWWQQKDMLPTSSEITAPTFSLATMKGQTYNFHPEQQSQKSLIYFFAPWCNICHASIDNMEAIKKSANDKVNLIAIALDWRTKEEVEAFLERHQLSIPVLLGTRQTRQDFKINAYPSYYVINKKGLIDYKDMGYTTELGMRIRLGLSKS